MYELVGGPLAGHRYELPEYHIGQGFEFGPDKGPLDGTAYILEEDGLLHYLPPNKGRKRDVDPG